MALLETLEATLDRFAIRYGRLGRKVPHWRVLRARYFWRRNRRRVITISGIEPGSKSSMPQTAKLEVQRRVHDAMTGAGWRAFRAPVALRLRFDTTAVKPPTAYDLAKNFLDLLGPVIPGLQTGRGGLLYGDDRQVHALSVMCKHGNEAPSIIIEIRPLRDFLDDLSMLAYGYDYEHEDEGQYDDALNFARSLQNKEESWTNLLGADSYGRQRSFAEESAQEAFLSRVGLSPFDLARLYRAIEVPGEDFDHFFSGLPLHVVLGELPHEDGTSKAWKAAVAERLSEFRGRLGWLISPLRMPIAVVVVVKPAPPLRTRGLHDLDNLMKSYVLPRVIDIFAPVSDSTFFLRENTPAVNGVPITAFLNAPPNGTRIGVNRFEAWRLRAAEESARGFVSIGITPDRIGLIDLFDRIDEDIEQWLDKQHGREV